MRELDKEEKNPRYIAFIAVVGIAFLILVSKLFTSQVLNAAVYEERALQNRIRTNVVKATRGQIFDREGKLLAKNITGYQLIHTDTKPLTPKDMEILNQLKNMNEQQISERLTTERKPVAEKLYDTIMDVKKISAVTGYTPD